MTAPSAFAQTTTTVGIGATVVEYDGFLTSGAATLTPAVRYDASNLSVGGQGSWTVFESGNQIFQATGAAAWFTPARDRLRIEFSGTAGLSNYADEGTNGHALARSRLHWFGAQQGAWIGATTGASFDSATVNPVEVGIGAWTLRDRIALVGTVTAVAIDDARHVDVAAAARWTTSRVEIEARLGARPWARRGDSRRETFTTAWGELSLLASLSSQLSFAVSGGSYAADPVRRLLGARYITAGLRIALSGVARPGQLSVAPPIIARVRAANSGTAPARLEIARDAQMHVLRVHVRGAKSVELMADFTDWEPVTLKHASGDVWEIRQLIDAGVHRLNIRIDGGAWQVPEGARVEEDEFGGVVGVVVF